MLSQNPEPKFKYSKNRIFVTSHFGTLLRNGITVRLLLNRYYRHKSRLVKVDFFVAGLLNIEAILRIEHCNKGFELSDYQMKQFKNQPANHRKIERVTAKMQSQ